MTEQVITVTPSTPLQDFARICTEDQVSGAPVCQVDGRLMGIVSKTDLIEHLLQDDPKFGASELLEFPEELRQVDDIMQTDLQTVSPDTPIGEIARLMAEERVHRVVVLEGERLIGIITSLDILQHYPQ